MGCPIGVYYRTYPGRASQDLSATCCSRWHRRFSFPSMSIFTSVGKQFVWTDENIITQERSLVPSIWLELSKERRFSFLSRSIFTSVEKHFVWTDENIRTHEGRLVPLNWHQYDWNFHEKIGYMLNLPVDCSVKDDKETWKIGFLLWTWVVMWVIYLNPVGLWIYCKIAGSILKERAGLLSVKFHSMANDVFFHLQFAKLKEMETTGSVILIIRFSVILWFPGKWLEMEEYVGTS